MVGPFRVQITGPLEPHASGFAVELRAKGYTDLSAANLMRLLAHVSRWLAEGNREPTELTAALVDDYLAARRAAGYTCWLSPRGLGPLMRYLQRLGVIPEHEVPGPLTPLDGLLANYVGYLVNERGLTPSVVGQYESTARQFLSEHGGGRDATAAVELTSAVVSEFVLTQSAHRAVGALKLQVTALRSLLRYLHLQGLTDRSLVGAVPAVAGWRLSGLPRGLAPPEVAALLASCDRQRPAGRRDYTILVLLLRLGLRAREVASLSLGDVDWRAGDITVRGKGRRDERLPLPSDVGEVLAAYLGSEPSRGTGRSLFCSLRAPQGPMSAGAVTAVVGEAARRAGLRSISAHRLRHTAATEMLRAGATLADVGQVLRHRYASTTAIYAKVDRSALRGLARSWPGGSSAIDAAVDRSALRGLAWVWPGEQS